MAKGKILLIDDEQIFLVAHHEELQDAGYEIVTALTGKDAITVAEKEKFDIVYVDLIMPDMNGVEVCKEMKKVSPDTVVVLVSGQPKEILKYWKSFLDAGGKDKILRKPLRDK
ncbi:MAG: response regulator, partial [Candidatus Marinimicrobia bacterium]|nr:response regulator [Candidatus Neomarinimicrobiota bacterium]